MSDTPQKAFMGMMSRGGSMGDTKVGATISKRDMRVPLAKLNRATRLTIKQPLCDSEQALLDYICKTPALIDPGQPFASPEERVLISDALGIAYTPDNIVNGALKKARRAERRRLGLPDRPRGRPMGAAGHGAHALSLHWIPCQNGLTEPCLWAGARVHNVCASICEPAVSAFDEGVRTAVQLHHKRRRVGPQTPVAAVSIFGARPRESRITDSAGTASRDAELRELSHARQALASEKKTVLRLQAEKEETRVNPQFAAALRKHRAKFNTRELRNDKTDYMARDVNTRATMLIRVVLAALGRVHRVSARSLRCKLQQIVVSKGHMCDQIFCARARSRRCLFETAY